MAALSWSDRHAASLEGEIGRGKREKGPTSLKSSQMYGTASLGWHGRIWGYGHYACLPQHKVCLQLSLAFALWNANDLWLHTFSPLFRKNWTEHDAELLPQMPLSSEFWVIVPQLPISQGPRVLPVTAGSSLAAFIFASPTRQSQQGANRFAAKRTPAKPCKSRHSVL